MWIWIPLLQTPMVYLRGVSGGKKQCRFPWQIYFDESAVMLCEWNISTSGKECIHNIKTDCGIWTVICAVLAQQRMSPYTNGKKRYIQNKNPTKSKLILNILETLDSRVLHGSFMVVRYHNIITLYRLLCNSKWCCVGDTKNSNDLCQRCP